MSGLKKITAPCPCCHAGKDKIVYQNAGPIVRVFCTHCGLTYKDEDAWDNDFRNIVDYWNHIDDQMPEDQ